MTAYEKAAVYMIYMAAALWFDVMFMRDLTK
jgi:hypothetical protein